MTILHYVTSLHDSEVNELHYLHGFTWIYSDLENLFCLYFIFLGFVNTGNTALISFFCCYFSGKNTHWVFSCSSTVLQSVCFISSHLSAINFQYWLVEFLHKHFRTLDLKFTWLLLDDIQSGSWTAPCCYRALVR